MMVENFKDKLFIGSYWAGGRGETYGECLVKARTFLCALRPLVPQLDPVFVWGPSQKKSQWVAKDLSDFDEIAGTRMLYFSSIQARRQKILPDTVSTFGFGISLSNRSGKNTEPDHITLSMSIGSQPGYSAPDSLRLQHISYDYYPEFQSIDKLSDILRLIATYWRPDYAVVTTDCFDDKTLSYELAERGAKRIGLLTYFSDKGLANILNEFGSVFEMEGGVVLKIADTLDNLKKPEVIKTSIAARDKLFEQFTA